MIYETMVNFLLGHNDYIEPFVLPQGAYARGVNVTSRGGLIKTRPRIAKVMDLPAGRFQGVFSSRQFVVFSFGGAFHRYKKGDAVTEEVTEVSCSPYAPRCWACDVNDVLLINDAVGKPVTVGLESARRLGEGELPCGSVCAFGQGRVFFADRFQRTLQAGDIALPYDPANVFKFSEQDTLNEGLFIQQPASSGLIQELSFIRNYQSGEGLGQLVAFSDGAVNAYNVYLPRGQWFAEDAQIGQQLFRLDGTAGEGSVHQLNNDLIFRGRFPRSLRSASSEVADGMQNLPLTMATYHLLTRDSGALTHSTGAVLDNYIYYTFGGHTDPTDGSVYFDSIAPYDLASVVSSGQAQTTADGLWNGHKFLAVFVFQNELYAVIREDDGSNVLCRFTEDIDADYTGAAVRSRVYTPKFGFKNPFEVKEFLYAEAWFDKTSVETDVTVYYRGDDVLWAPSRTHTIAVSGYPATGSSYDVFPQYRKKIRLTAVGKEINVSHECTAVGTAFQFCVEFTGVSVLERVSFVCTDAKLGAELECDDYAAVENRAIDGRVNLNDYSEVT